MGRTRRAVAVEPAARTASGDSGVLDADQDRYGEVSPQRAVLILDVTAASGTGPTLDVVVEVRDPASGGWVQIAAFAQASAAGRETLFIGGGGDTRFLTGKYRIRWSLAGTTPSFTFSVGAIYVF